MYTGIVLTKPDDSEAQADVLLRAMPLASQGRTEAWLRDFLLAHPSALPSGTVDPAYADPIPVCRELRTRAGRIDCLFVTRFGGLIIVECKLWRNPQARREVIGQILDYAKEISAWKYADLQREVSIALGRRGTNALFDLVSGHYPDTIESEFVDALTLTLSRGRLMLLVAGDGIREETESIVQYLGKSAGLQFTFGLVEMIGYEMPDGYLLVQSRILAKTLQVERAVIRVEGNGANLVEVLSSEESPVSLPSLDASDEAGHTHTPRRAADPVAREADSRWRAEFGKRVRFDDPAQSTGRTGYGWIQFDLPVPWAWMTAFSSRRVNKCGNTLVLRGESGQKLFEGLLIQQSEITAELSAIDPDIKPVWQQDQNQCELVCTKSFTGPWGLEQEEAQLSWLLEATNSFVNALRPRVLALLPRGGDI